ncbi:MAG: hypothetical protein R3E58_06200 [Phycisphaerae bacterium]
MLTGLVEVAPRGNSIAIEPIRTGLDTRRATGQGLRPGGIVTAD